MPYVCGMHILHELKADFQQWPRGVKKWGGLEGGFQAEGTAKEKALTMEIAKEKQGREGRHGDSDRGGTVRWAGAQLSTSL